MVEGLFIDAYCGKLSELRVKEAISGFNESTSLLSTGSVTFRPESEAQMTRSAQCFRTPSRMGEKYFTSEVGLPASSRA